MGLKKCPRCELNYIQEEENYCNVCKREIKGEADNDEAIVICIECGERETVKGSDLCPACLREVMRQEKLASASEQSTDTVPIDLDAVELDDIDVPVPRDDDIPETELEEIENELGDDDDIPDDDNDPVEVYEDEGIKELEEIGNELDDNFDDGDPDEYDDEMEEPDSLIGDVEAGV